MLVHLLEIWFGIWWRYFDAIASIGDMVGDIVEIFDAGASFGDMVGDRVEIFDAGASFGDMV